MNCLGSILNVILYIINVVFLIGGILLITLGSIMLSHVNQYSGVENVVQTNTIPICVTTLGGLIFLISFFGCCGICRQSACLTGTYSLMMFLLFVLQLVLTCWIAVNRNDFFKEMSNFVDTVWNENTAANGYPMGVLELTFSCCGDTGYQNYASSGQSVPGTCCGYGNRSQSCSPDIYTTRQGCKEKFTDFWTDNINLVLWSGIGICIYEFLVSLLAGGLARSMYSGGRMAV